MLREKEVRQREVSLSRLERSKKSRADVGEVHQADKGEGNMRLTSCQMKDKHAPGETRDGSNKTPKCVDSTGINGPKFADMKLIV